MESQKLQSEKQELLDLCASEEKLLRGVLEQAVEERQQLESKYKHDFEQMRNQAEQRQEKFLDDCEWRVRDLMRQCKEKIDKADKERREAVQRAQDNDKLLAQQKSEIKQLRTCEAEVAQLRGLTNDQSESLKRMMRRADELTTELYSVNERLADEIENCRMLKVKYQ